MVKGNNVISTEMFPQVAKNKMLHSLHRIHMMKLVCNVAILYIAAQSCVPGLREFYRAIGLLK